MLFCCFLFVSTNIKQIKLSRMNGRVQKNRKQIACGLGCFNCCKLKTHGKSNI
jgi:hypothetical protein